MTMPGPETPALQISDITVRFGGMTALDAVSLQVQGGARHGILGPNGAGKTTMFNVITGFLAPDSGRVAIKGIDATRMPAHKRVGLGLARTFQITTLFPALTSLENVMMGTLARILQQEGGRYGCATMCVGAGQGVAMIIENLAN